MDECYARSARSNPDQRESDENMNATLTEKDTTAIQDILIRQLEVSRDQLTPEAKIMADLGADSLDIIEISMSVEERFDLSMPEEQQERIETVGELYEAVGVLMERNARPRG